MQLTMGAAPFLFKGRMEENLAPATCAAFRKLLPFKNQVVHSRWSSERWIPSGELDLGSGYENHTSHPGAEDIILHQGGLSETETLLAYGGVSFSSKAGQLASNRFLIITEGRANLAALR